MKLSTILPILAAAANKRQKKKDNDRKASQDRYWVPDRFSASNFPDQCSSMIPDLGGIFETTNDGLSGQVNLDNYPNKVRCQHVVQANNSCEAIKITYRTIAVETDYDGCSWDEFRFGWPDNKNDLHYTPARCNCLGDGCEPNNNILALNIDFEFAEEAVGPTEFSVASNTFTFFFKSDATISQGQVAFDWECVDAASAASTNIVSISHPNSCSETHDGYEEFGNQVRSAIELGVANDIYYFSRKPGVITQAARNRVDQFSRWFVNIFDVWYTDVTEASKTNNRKCLTDNFPYDSPGNVDKESVLTYLSFPVML